MIWEADFLCSKRLLAFGKVVFWCVFFVLGLLLAVWEAGFLCSELLLAFGEAAFPCCTKNGVEVQLVFIVTDTVIAKASVYH